MNQLSGYLALAAAAVLWGIFTPEILGLGFLTVTATYLLQFAGLALTTAVNATVVIGLEPMEATGLVTWGGLVTLVPVSALLTLVPLPSLGPTPGGILQIDPGSAFLALVYLGIFCTLGAGFLWNWGLNRVSGGISGIFMAVEPLVGVLLAVTLLGEPFTIATAAGTSLVLDRRK